MNTYVIRRREAWSTPAELQAAAERSTAVAEEEFPGRISWIRSYVVEEADGGLGTICIYQAADADAVRDHAAEVGMPADEVLPAAIDYIRDLAMMSSPASMAAMKRQVYTDLNQSFGAAQAQAVTLMKESFTRPDFAEGVKSFLERRPPAFPRLGAG